jgi:hypothetical protein
MQHGQILLQQKTLTRIYSSDGVVNKQTKMCNLRYHHHVKKKTIALFAMMILLTSVLAVIRNISTPMTANAQTTNTCSNIAITGSGVTANGDGGGDGGVG